MNSKSFILGFIAHLLVAASAFAHSPLTATKPADGAVVGEELQTIKMVFGKPARLIKVIMTKDDTDETRVEIPSKSFMQEFELDADHSKPGTYEIQWRALSKDGHILKGSFGFTKE